MLLLDQILASFRTVLSMSASIVLLAALEAVIPARARGRCHRAHLWPNLSLSAITFVTNAVLNAVLVLAMMYLDEAGYRPLRWMSAVGAVVAAVLALDPAWYVGHRGMHRSTWLWRIRVDSS